jgi:hypothetical protein
MQAGAFGVSVRAGVLLPLQGSVEAVSDRTSLFVDGLLVLNRPLFTSSLMFLVAPLFHLQLFS